MCMCVWFYAAGNVLAVAILILIWYSWGILAAFQEPLLWAWLCSLSLRDVKRFLVSTARSELHRRCVVWRAYCSVRVRVFHGQQQLSVMCFW